MSKVQSQNKKKTIKEGRKKEKEKEKVTVDHLKTWAKALKLAQNICCNFQRALLALLLMFGCILAKRTYTEYKGLIQLVASVVDGAHLYKVH